MRTIRLDESAGSTIILNGGKTEQLKTHDRGETIIRKIRVNEPRIL